MTVFYYCTLLLPFVVFSRCVQFQAFASLPETVDELDEAIHSLETRIECLAHVDNAVSLFTGVYFIVAALQSYQGGQPRGNLEKSGNLSLVREKSAKIGKVAEIVACL